MKIHFRISYILILNMLILTQKGFTNPTITYTESNQELGTSAFCASGDLDNDGDQDIIVAHWSNPGTIYLNDGNGQFVSNGQSLSISNTRKIALSDLDSDNDLDLFIGTDSRNYVYFNDGSGQFSDSGQRLGYYPSFGVSLGDVDNDGDTDAVLANFHTSAGSATRNKIWLNDGTGHFTDSGKYLGTTIADNLQLGDLNCDGNLDAVIGNCREPGIKVWLGDGTGDFSVTDQSFGNGGTLALADFDGDGDLDLFRGMPATSELWLNDGSGVFTKTSQSLENVNDTGVWGASTCDVDGDDDIDIIVALGDGRGLGTIENTPNMIWLNDGTGNFTDSGLRLGSGSSGEVAVQDFNNDGLPDIYFTNDSPDPDKVWFCQTQGPSTVKNEILKSAQFKLFNNYPNPFNPSTTISYSLEEPASVKISIYNTQGQCVKILENSFQTAGQFSVVWDGTDLNGNLVSSGVYFYHLLTNDFVIQKKMLFVQ